MSFFLAARSLIWLPEDIQLYLYSEYPPSLINSSTEMLAILYSVYWWIVKYYRMWITLCMTYGKFVDNLWLNEKNTLYQVVNSIPGCQELGTMEQVLSQPEQA